MTVSEKSLIPKSRSIGFRKVSFPGIRCVVFLLVVSFLASASFGQNGSTKKERPESVKKAAVLEFHGPIDYKLYAYFLARLNQAEKAKVDLLIIDIDSPGGLLEESLDIAERLSNVDWACTVAYVSNEAISGAALVSLGCDYIVIGEKGLFGDIGAIYQEKDGAFRYIPAKLNSYLVQDAAKLAASKGRSRELAEAMIDKDRVVYWNPNAADNPFKLVHVDSDDKPGPPWQMVGESGKDRFLTVNGKRAVDLGLADINVNDLETLETEFNFDNKKALQYRYTSTDTVVFYLNLPLITGLIVVIGLISLYIELSAPGIGVGGLISGLCATLFFWSKFMGGTSTWLEVVLFLAGLVFLAFELFIIPGFGLSGLMGLLLLVGSVIMASQDFVVPETDIQMNQFVTTLLMLLCSGGVVMVAAIFVTKRLGKIPVLSRLILAPTPENTGEREPEDPKTNLDGKPVPQAHPDISVGDWGSAESLLRPAGRARFNRRSFDVVSDGSYIQPGQPVKVVDISGNRIVVTEVDDLLPETTYKPNDDAEDPVSDEA